MRLVALGLWLANACLGSYLMIRWLVSGGLRRQATKVTPYPLALIFAHPLAAACGLALWAAYLETRRPELAWSSFGLLCLVALLGFALFTRWLTGRGGRHARDRAARRPGPAMLLHGLIAITMFVLVLLTASAAGH